MKKYIVKIIITAWLFVAMINFGFAQAGDNDKLPFDPNVKKGTLENGMTYYIKKNTTPKNVVDLRLVIKVGSVDEVYEEQGMTHFIQHMAFYETKNIKRETMKDYMEKMGMIFGPDVSSKTDFEKTVYNLNVSTGSQNLVDTGLFILKEWSRNILFYKDKIENEKRHVLEEWNMNRGPMQRMRDIYLPKLYYKSKFALRLPTGKKETIIDFDSSSLKKFYDKWYRPDLMAIVAVGDVDPNLIEKQIKKIFSTIPTPKKELDKVNYRLIEHNRPQISVASDKEYKYNIVQIIYKHDILEEETHKDYRKKIMINLYTGMLNNRLKERLEEQNSPLMYTNVAYEKLLNQTDDYHLVALSKKNKIINSLGILLEENERAKRYGFTKTEMERHKMDMLKWFDVIEKNVSNSKKFAEEYIRNFSFGEPIPGIAYEGKMYRRYLPQIKVEELNALSKELSQNKNIVVVALTPDNKDIKKPKEEEIRNLLKSIHTKKLDPYEDHFAQKPLLNDIEQGSKVLEEIRDDKLGVIKWRLANGAKIVLKPTKVNQDEIIMRAFSFGGTSLYKEEDIIAARIAADVINNSGVGEFDKNTLKKMLAGKSVKVNFKIKDYHEEIYGISSNEDFETMLQLNYLYFTKIRESEEDFHKYLSILNEKIENNKNNPMYVYQDTITTTLQGNNLFFKPLNKEILNYPEFERVMEVFQERFSNAYDFTFYFVGAFEPNKIKGLIEKYIGAIPSERRIEVWKDNKFRMPRGVIKKEVKKGISSQSACNISFLNHNFKYKNIKILELKVLAEYILIRLRERTAKEEKDIYNVEVKEVFNKYPVANSRINISFRCSYENMDMGKKHALDELKKIQVGQIDTKILEKVKRRILFKRELSENNELGNVFLSETLMNVDLYGVEDNKEDYKKMLKRITPNKLRQIAYKNLNFNNYVKVVLKPENKTDNN